ncbi:phasin family protein [Massilia sp. ZL223]|uniref:phasin family protein n=1 Tax=Massilia sp. ZL223 TaxID=2824904 RepID=UPI001B83A80F|nr:phasin family protein [Massilia sp. ZL223]MBQ5964844.1 phasin family protein [Massilia sp. ZL223]
MTSLPEQLTAARTAQLEAQFALFRSVTKQALDNASRVLALNISTSRDSVERSSQAVRELFTATSPQDLPTLQQALRSHAEEQFRSLFTYGRELFSIASGAQSYAVRGTQAPAALPAPVPEAPEAPAAALAEAVQPAVAETIAEPVKAEAQELAAYVQEHIESKEPAVVAETIEVVDEPAPVAEPKPIAKAAGKGVPKAAVVPHPLSAPVPENDAVELPKIEPAPAQGGKRRK